MERYVSLEAKGIPDYGKTEYRVYVDGKYYGKSWCGEYLFLDVDEGEHTVYCEEFVRVGDAEDAPFVRRQISDVVTVPAGTENHEMFVDRGFLKLQLYVLTLLR